MHIAGQGSRFMVIYYYLFLSNLSQVLLTRRLLTSSGIRVLHSVTPHLKALHATRVTLHCNQSEFLFSSYALHTRERTITMETIAFLNDALADGNGYVGRNPLVWQNGIPRNVSLVLHHIARATSLPRRPPHPPKPLDPTGHQANKPVSLWGSHLGPKV